MTRSRLAALLLAGGAFSAGCKKSEPRAAACPGAKTGAPPIVTVKLGQ